MINFMYFFIFGAMLCAFNFQAHAAFVLTGTRFIYDEEQKSISFVVTNDANTQYGGQVWIDNTTQAADQVYMVPAPSFFRVEPEQQQVIRLLKVNEGLPEQRESLFWLNVMELPPKQEVEKGQVAFAMNTKVKLIHRPDALGADRQGAETQVKIVENNDRLIFENPTPYYFAITSVRVNGKAVSLDDTIRPQLGTLAPFTKVDVTALNLPKQGKVTFSALNDWGGADEYTLRGE